jgi:hypothetical protein
VIALTKGDALVIGSRQEAPVKTRRVGRRTAWTLGGALALAGAVVAAQSGLAQFGVAEAEAHQQILETLSSGGGYAGAPIVNVARRGYAKIAPAGRAAATTALYAWTKAHVNSAAFKADYAKMRTDEKPELRPTVGTPDQEMQAKIDKDVADMQTSFQQMKAILAPADLAKLEGELKTQTAQMRSKPYMDAIRAEIVDKRAKDKADYDMLMTQWNTNLPADPNSRIAAILREFLANTADVDFAARTKTFVGEGGDTIGFVNDAYNKKPWQWRVAFDYGPEVLAAARASASAWLKELPAK